MIFKRKQKLPSKHALEALERRERMERYRGRMLATVRSAGITVKDDIDIWKLADIDHKLSEERERPKLVAKAEQRGLKTKGRSNTSIALDINRHDDYQALLRRHGYKVPA